jgi:hypothetical protein
MSITLMLGCRRLGVARESSFEEVQDAKNYLWEVGPLTRTPL